jgi:hypothetical protein
MRQSDPDADSPRIVNPIWKSRARLLRLDNAGSGYFEHPVAPILALAVGFAGAELIVHSCYHRML